MKGVILAGGLGKRLYPLTKITNKHLLPVYNKPMIYYPIEALIDAGIEDIMIVTGGNFAGDFLQLLGNGREFGLKDLHYTYQEGEGGIADALSSAEHFVEDDRCIVILGDNIFEKSIRSYVERYKRQKEGAKIIIKEVPDPQRFGVPVIQGDKIVAIEEKPKKPKSPYSVTGIYMYDRQIWEIIHTLVPSQRNELEITDVNNAYIAKNMLTYDILDGWWTDAGTFESLVHAQQLVSQKDHASRSKNQ